MGDRKELLRMKFANAVHATSVYHRTDLSFLLRVKLCVLLLLYVSSENISDVNTLEHVESEVFKHKNRSWQLLWKIWAELECVFLPQDAVKWSKKKSRNCLIYWLNYWKNGLFPHFLHVLTVFFMLLICLSLSLLSVSSSFLNLLSFILFSFMFSFFPPFFPSCLAFILFL